MFCRVRGGITYYLRTISQSVVTVLLTVVYIPRKGIWLSHVVGEICVC